MSFNDQRLYLGPAATRVLTEFDSEAYEPSSLFERQRFEVEQAAADAGGVTDPAADRAERGDRVRSLLRCMKELREVAAPEVRNQLSLVIPPDEGVPEYSGETILALFDVLAAADPEGSRVSASKSPVH